MKTATVRDLRNHFSRVSAWIEGGEEVELTKRGKVVARIVPVQVKATDKSASDYLRRLKRIYGDRVTSDSQALISEGRGER
jgi:antitoxin (DNA-binding transcriptional repressor) of toxin-antitoxin stability system